MALQQINWDQINSEYVPSGSTVSLGSSSTPLTAVHTDSLFVNGVNITGSGSGTSGSSGSSGTSGATGAAGSSGSSGTSGGSGSSGTSGTSGTSGISGTSGSSGSSGVNGTSGTSGSSGSSGSNGSSGTSGQSGSSGSSGTSGARGSSGTSGTSGNIYLTTSNTTLTDIDELVDTTQTIFVDTQLSYSVGQLIIVAYDVNNYLIGRVDTYDSTSGQLIFVVDSVAGASSHNDWTVNLYASGQSGTGGGGGVALTVTDGSTTVNSVDRIVFSGATISNLGGGDVRVTITGGGGGTGSSGTSGTSGSSGSNGSSGSSGISGTSGTSGNNGSSGTSGTSGSSGVAGTSGTSGTSGQNGTSGTSGTSGEAGTSGTSGTSGSSGNSGGAVKVYQFSVSTTSNVIDNFPAGLLNATGPQGESLATLQAAGWTFTKVASTTLSITRPNGLQTQPLVNIMTHGVDASGNVWSKAPTGVAVGSLSAMQTTSGGLYTTCTLYSLNSSNCGFPSSGAGTLIITFGLVS